MADELRNQKAYLELSFKDEVLTNYCRIHCQLMAEKGSTTSAMKVLRNVCKQLNQFNWSSVIDVTSDFVVAAVDSTGEVDPVKDIKAVVPTSSFKALKQQGFV